MAPKKNEGIPYILEDMVFKSKNTFQPKLNSLLKDISDLSNGPKVSEKIWTIIGCLGSLSEKSFRNWCLWGELGTSKLVFVCKKCTALYTLKTERNVALTLFFISFFSEPSELVFDPSVDTMMRRWEDFQSMVDQAIIFIQKEVLGRCLGKVPATTWLELQHRGETVYDYMQMLQLKAAQLNSEVQAKCQSFH